MEASDINWLDQSLDFSTPVPRDFGQDDSQQEQHLPHLQELRFLQSHEWDPCNISAGSIYYSVEWTLYLQGKKRRSKLTDNTERNIGLSPPVYWQTELKPKIDAVIKEKQQKDTYTAKDTKIIISAPGTRSGGLKLRYKSESDIQWNEIEAELVKLSPQLRLGKKLKVEIEIEYKKLSESVSSTSGGRKSATNRQLQEALSVQDQNKAKGKKTAFSTLFPIFECPQLGCKIGPYCWKDPDSMVRYKVEIGLLQLMWKGLEEGTIDKIDCHADVPKHIRDIIREEKPSKRKESQLPPIHITNVLPGSENGERPFKRLRFDGITDEDIEQIEMIGRLAS